MFCSSPLDERNVPQHPTPNHMAFKSLFTPTAQPTDGMTQAAREAIVDLLHFGMYVDKHIALAEDEMIEAAARSMDWDPMISWDYYEGKSIGAVRRIGKDETARADFFIFVRQRLPREADRKLALELLEKLYACDGMTTAEAETLPMIRRELE